MIRCTCSGMNSILPQPPCLYHDPEKRYWYEKARKEMGEVSYPVLPSLPTAGADTWVGKDPYLEQAKELQKLKTAVSGIDWTSVLEKKCPECGQVESAHLFTCSIASLDKRLHS